MELEAYLRALRRDGDLLAATAGLDLDAPVSSCPGWTVRDLVIHTGSVHQWARAQVAGKRQKPEQRDATNGAEQLDRDDLLEWFAEGVDALAITLENADPELDCWTFLPAESPRIFWARRQTHETAVHRADVELTCGALTGIPVDQALDGLDELLNGFLGRAGRSLNQDSPATLAFRATDDDKAWTVTIGPDMARVDAGTRGADCEVVAGASDLFYFCWNRLGMDAVTILGDARLVELFQSSVHV